MANDYYRYEFLPASAPSLGGYISIGGVRAPKYTSIAVMCYILQLYLARVSTVFTSTFGIFFANAGSNKKLPAI